MDLFSMVVGAVVGAVVTYISIILAPPYLLPLQVQRNRIESWNLRNRHPHSALGLALNMTDQQILLHVAEMKASKLLSPGQPLGLDLVIPPGQAINLTIVEIEDGAPPPIIRESLVMEAKRHPIKIISEDCWLKGMTRLG